MIAIGECRITFHGKVVNLIMVLGAMLEGQLVSLGHHLPQVMKQSHFSKTSHTHQLPFIMVYHRHV